MDLPMLEEHLRLHWQLKLFDDPVKDAGHRIRPVIEEGAEGIKEDGAEPEAGAAARSAGRVHAPALAFSRTGTF